MPSGLPVRFFTESPAIHKQVMPVLTAATALLHIYGPCVPEGFFPSMDMQPCDQPPNKTLERMRVDALGEFGCWLVAHLSAIRWTEENDVNA